MVVTYAGAENDFYISFQIFEGEMAFTSAITNILHKLHNSSAAFELYVQIFISTDAITTDSLILKCIKKMWKMSKRPFDCPMSEDLTDGEICLSTFPSLNPLSSHAILCLGVPIPTFLSWPLEQQVSALQDFDVRSESLHLLKVQVLYGKLETSAHPNNISQHTWPSASEIFAPEVESHVKNASPYFPPASEITNCELEVEDARESDIMPTNERHDDLSLPDYLDPNFQAGRGVCTYQGVPNGVCWSNDGYQSFKLPHDACVHTERPESLQDYSSHCNPNDVQSILQQWIRRRKDGAKDLKQSVTDSELFCDSFEILNSESYHARPCKNKSPPSAAFTADAVYPGLHSTYRSCEATDEHRWAPVVRASDERKISALDQFRFRKRVSPAARSQKKKLKPAAPSTRSKDDGPSAQLEHSLKISRNSCYKFIPPIGRSI